MLRCLISRLREGIPRGAGVDLRNRHRATRSHLFGCWWPLVRLARSLLRPLPGNPRDESESARERRWQLFVPRMVVRCATVSDRRAGHFARYNVLWLTSVHSPQTACWPLAGRWQRRRSARICSRCRNSIPARPDHRLSLSLLLRTEEPWLHAVAAVIAIGSKFVFRVDGKHIWNPAGFAIVLLLLGRTACGFRRDSGDRRYGSPRSCAFSPSSVRARRAVRHRHLLSGRACNPPAAAGPLARRPLAIPLQSAPKRVAVDLLLLHDLGSARRPDVAVWDAYVRRRRRLLGPICVFHADATGAYAIALIASLRSSFSSSAFPRAVRDHEEGEDQQRPALELMQRDRERVAEPNGPRSRRVACATERRWRCRSGAPRAARGWRKSTGAWRTIPSIPCPGEIHTPFALEAGARLRSPAGFPDVLAIHPKDKFRAIAMTAATACSHAPRCAAAGSARGR